MLRAMAAPKAPILLGSSAVTGMAVTGTLSETTLATVTIPAGAMGLNGGIQVRCTFSYTNSANTKTIRIRLGGLLGTAYYAVNTTTTVTAEAERVIKNRGAANSQVGSMPAAAAPYSTNASAPTTSSIDTTAAVDLVFTGALSNTGETITLESYEVWLIPS